MSCLSWLQVVYFLSLAKRSHGMTLPLAMHEGKSRLFLDTADVSSWHELLPSGIFYGITTNPTILQSAGIEVSVQSVSRLAISGLEEVNEFMCQAWGKTADNLERCGIELFEAVSADDRLIIKVPLTFDGIVAMSRLKRRGIPICATACYDRRQAMTASALDCDYLAPYLGRMSDQGNDGLSQCISMQDAIRGMGGKTRLLVASLRDTETLFSVLSVGSDATFSAKVARDLLTGFPATDQAAHDFEVAASASSSS